MSRRALASLTAIGLGLPVIAVVGLVLSLWLFQAPRFEDLAVVSGTVARLELVRLRGGRYYAKLTLADGRLLYVRRPSRVSGERRTLEALMGQPVTAWVTRHALDTDGVDGVWQLARGRDTLLDFTDMLDSVDTERRRFRVFWVVAFVLGLGALAAAIALGARLSARGRFRVAR